MSVVVTVACPNGFSDMRIIKTVIKAGDSVDVTEAQFKQMKQSNPYVYVEDRKLKLNPGAKEKMKGEVEEWSPIGWYAAQLAKEPKEEEDATEA